MPLLVNTKRTAVRALSLVVAVAAGLVTASMFPGVSRVVRTTLASLPFLGVAQVGEAAGAKGAGPEGKRDPPSPAKAGGSHRATGGDTVLALSPDRIAMARIETAAVQGGRLTRHLHAPGTITPAGDRIARVPAKVVGTVAELSKRLGDSVTKGEVVAVLDSREVADARSEYLTASVNLDLQKTAFDRAQSLWDKRIMAESQFLQARATFTEAQLRLDLTRQKLLALNLDPKIVAQAAKQDTSVPGASSLRQYPVRSPSGGRIVERKVDVGTSVGQQGDPPELYTVLDLSLVWAELAVSTSDLPFIKQGERVVVATGGSDGESRKGEGRVVFVSPLLDRETRSARVVAEIPNPDESWRPGQFVTAEIAIEDQPAKVMVPKTALQTIAGEPAVFVRTPDGFEKRVVTLGRRDEQAVEVTAGLLPGEAVAITNSFALKAELGRAQTED